MTDTLRMGLDQLSHGGMPSTESPPEHSPRTAGANEAERIAVVIVDDHHIFRQGLSTMLEKHGLAVVGEADTGELAVKMVMEFAPEVVVMDLSLPGMPGIEAIRELSAVAPQSHVLVLTISGDDSDVTEAILAGACGYLLKDASIDEIVAAVRATATGESLISRRVATRLFDRIRAASPEPGAARAQLSEREVEVLRRVAQGKGNAQIAVELYISPKTVKNHISNILTKLQIENRIQAAVYAVRRGLA